MAFTAIVILLSYYSIDVLASGKGNTNWINPSNPFSNGDIILTATTLDTVTARWTSTYQSAHLDLFCGPNLDINRKYDRILRNMHEEVAPAKGRYHSMGTSGLAKWQRGLCHRLTRFRRELSTAELLLSTRTAEWNR